MKIALHPFGAGPAHLVCADRRLVEIGRVPVKRQPPGEVPAALLPHIIVGVHHLHDDPFAAAACQWGLVLVFRIDDPGGVIRVGEFDHVPADVVRGAGEGRAQRAVHIRAQGRAAAGVAPDADIGGEQADHRVDVAHIQRERVFGGELPDCVERFEPVDPPFQRKLVQGHASPNTAGASPIAMTVARPSASTRSITQDLRRLRVSAIHQRPSRVT